MLSGISQFLFGGSGDDVSQNTESNENGSNLAISPAENEWVLVDNAGTTSFYALLIFMFLLLSYQCVTVDMYCYI